MMFQPPRSVLSAHRPHHVENRIFLCFPVLVYRVTAPILRVHHLNIFEKVVLGLCRAGVRQPAEIAARIHQHVELCTYVVTQLRDAKRLDEFGAPTPAGLQSISTGRLDEEPEIVVTHVFQDPFTGELWPRTVETLHYRPVRRICGSEVELRPTSSGHPEDNVACLVTCDEVRASEPTPERIIAAVGAQHTAVIEHRAERFATAGRAPLAGFEAEQDLRALTDELTLPATEEIQRIVDVGAPVAEYLLCWLDADLSDEPEGGFAWVARDPFGLDPSQILERLVRLRLREDSGLTDAVEQLTAGSADQRRQHYQQSVRDVRRSAEATLVSLLGEQIRSYPQALDLLLEVEDAVDRGLVAAAVEKVAVEAYRVYEHLFRRIVAEHPPVARPNAIMSRANLRAQLEQCASDLGFMALRGVFPGRVEKVLNWRRRGPDERVTELATLVGKGFILDLVPFAVLGADTGSRAAYAGHPLAVLADRRPNAFAELEDLGALRNRGSHAERDPSAEEDIAWCREMALDAANAVLALSPQRVGRITD